jgi:TPP-dependent pyruvate/acetoin dehydrogenase alpha subunit
LKDILSIYNSLGISPQPRLDLHKYIQMSFIREVELLISRRYSEQIFRCPVHLSVGQEAIAVGVSWNLEDKDKAISTHRSHAHYLAKGGSLFNMFAELMGTSKGCCGGRGGSMHIFDDSVGFISSIPIVGSSIPISAGAALAEKFLNSGRVVVAYIGDASLETGAFFETLNIASLKKIPLLIVIEDNGYSTYANKSVRVSKNREVKTIVEGFGIPFFSGNGDSIDEVIELSKVAIDLTRSNQTVVLEFSTFRLLEHCGPNNDDSMGYRSREEIASYNDRDPLMYLVKKFDETQISSLNKIIVDYVESQYAKAREVRESEFIDFQKVFSS